MERTILESRACWESGKNRTWARIQQKRLITYRTLINLGSRFKAERTDMRQALTYIAYFHTHTLDVNHTNETITAAKDVDSLFPFEVSNTRWGTDSPLLTVTVKNYTEAEKFENSVNAFKGLYIIDVSTKRVYRLAGTPTKLVRVMNGYHTRLPWLNPRYEGKTSMMQDGDTDGFLGKFLDYA